MSKIGQTKPADFFFFLFNCWTRMNDSKDFANELFDALARPRGITSASLFKHELQEFWEQITDESSDARLQTFLDM